MNGSGFQCDQCGRKDVRGHIDRFMTHGMEQPPLGWYVVFGPADSAAAVDVPRHDFCTRKCVELFAGGAEPTERPY